MKKLFVVMSLLVASLGVGAKNTVSVYVTHAYGNGAEDLRSAIGSIMYEIDSLAVVGILFKGEFDVLRECCVNGRLTGLDLSKCQIVGGMIPDYAFCPENINGAKNTRADDNRNDYYTNLQYIKLPVGLDSIGDKAFFRTNIRKLEIPRSVKRIGDEAFGGCEYLRNVTVRNFIPPVGGTEFNGFPNASLYVPVGSGEKYAATDGWNSFDIVESENSFITLSVSLDGKSTIKEILGDNLYKADSLVITGYMQNDEENYETRNDFYTLNGAVKKGILTGINMKDVTNEYLADLAFNDGFRFENFNVTVLNSNLMYITLPDNLKEIGINSFYYGKSLKTIEFPSTLKSIGYGAFEGCTGLNKIILPEGLTSLDRRCFFDCDNVGCIYLPSTLEQVGELALHLNYIYTVAPPCDVYCNRSFPPATISESGKKGIFANSQNEASCRKWLSNWTLYVPMGAKENYLTSENGQWKYFGRIIETPELTGITDGIGNAVADVATEGVEVYTADGRMVSKGKAMPSLGKGLYIVKKGGETKKVFIGR